MALRAETVEQYGARLGSRSSGLGQAANGVGKILGPRALALLAGGDNVIAPKTCHRVARTTAMRVDLHSAPILAGRLLRFREFPVVEEKLSTTAKRLASQDGYRATTKERTARTKSSSVERCSTSAITSSAQRVVSSMVRS